MNATLAGIVVLATATFASALDAYRAGRFEHAAAEFRADIERRGDDAPAESFANLALASLRAGALTDAEQAARTAAERDPDGFTGFARFVDGSVAFARCDQSLAQASGPEAESFALDIALAQAVRARDAWRDAARSRSDWPEARRNVERALRRIDELERMKRERETPPPEREPDPPPANDPLAADRDPQATADELPPERVLDLLQRLDAKEREKRLLRAKARATRPATGERDW